MFLAARRKGLEYHAELSIQRLALNDDPKPVRKQLDEWESES